MALTPAKTIQPPVNDPPLIDYPTGQRHSQAWTEWNQLISDRLTQLPADLAALSTGVTNGSDAVPGKIGEYVTASSSGSVAPSTGAVVNIASLSLQAGDWDVEGNVIFNPTGVVSFASASVNTVSATLGAIATRIGGGGSGTQLRIGSGGSVRVSVSAPATVFLVAQVAFSTGSMGIVGTVWARRQR